jgi:SulP family sulfate permease
MTAGIAMGVLLSLLSFAQRMNRSFVQHRYKASARPSRRNYPAAVESRLAPLRESIIIFELGGALFFGSGDLLVDEADALRADCRCLVLDLHRVSAIDESGAMALQTTVLRARLRGIRVELAGLANGSAPALALRSFAPALPCWPDADRAVEAAERLLLGGTDLAAMVEVPLTESSLLAGMDAEQVAVVTAHLQVQHLGAGEALFAEGELGDRLYVVSQGSVSMISLPDKNGRTQRYLSVSPGMMFGETSMLDGGGRTAAAVADSPTVVHVLTLAALNEIGRTHPEVAIPLYRNVALHLSQRLRSAAAAWRTSAG